MQLPTEIICAIGDVCDPRERYLLNKIIKTDYFNPKPLDAKWKEFESQLWYPLYSPIEQYHKIYTNLKNEYIYCRQTQTIVGK